MRAKNVVSGFAKLGLLVMLGMPNFKASADNSSFLSNMSPVPLEPSLFCVDLAAPNLSGAGLYHSVEAIAGSISYTWSSLPSIEAGKQFAIRYKRTSLAAPESGSLEKVELFYKIDGGVVQSRLVGDGFRNPSTGELILSPAIINVPHGARNAFEYWFQLTTSDGKKVWDRAEAEPYFVSIIPESSSILKFDSNWNFAANETLLAGQSFRIAYDVSRIKSRLTYLYRNDVPVWNVAALVSFDSAAPIEVSLTAVSHDVHGVASDVSMLMPAVKIPKNAKSVSLWFVGRDYVSKVYDSNFGKNYTFSIQNADSSN